MSRIISCVVNGLAAMRAVCLLHARGPLDITITMPRDQIESLRHAWCDAYRVITHPGEDFQIMGIKFVPKREPPRGPMMYSCSHWGLFKP